MGTRIVVPVPVISVHWFRVDAGKLTDIAIEQGDLQIMLAKQKNLLIELVIVLIRDACASFVIALS